ncbi:MAG: NfeD family protein [Tissierellia bacterium]|nr:NfeD family protein [Tissierellia bacterium]
MKRQKFLILITTFLLLVFNFIPAFSKSSKDVYIIPIKGEINLATSNFVKESIEKAEYNGAEAIIFEIDTYGGLIDSAEKIKNSIFGTDIPTISFINTKAESAGVLISLASEKVAMAPGSTIGSAEPIPNNEKILSMWRAMLREVAEYRERDKDIVEAMADKDIYVPGLSEEGKLLNLTAKEAKTHGICDIISSNKQDILNEFGISGQLVEIEESISGKLARILGSQAVSSFLLVVAFVAMAVEIFAPGFGLPGIISIIAFVLFFSGNVLAGYSGWLSILLFVIGIVLMGIEAIIPGFGLPGIAGIILLFLGLASSMGSLAKAATAISLAVISAVIVIVVLIKFGKRSKLFDRITLQNTSSKERGFISSDEYDFPVGTVAIALTDLRPSGFIELDGKKLDALASSDYINRGSTVIIDSIVGSKIIVKEK